MKLIAIKRFLSLFSVFLLFVTTVTAKEYTVSSDKEISELVLNAGDKVILKKGIWKDQSLVFKGKGTADKPIVFKAEQAGETIMSGKSALIIDGEFLVVDGLVKGEDIGPVWQPIKKKFEIKN